MVSIDIQEMYCDRQCERLWPVPIGVYVNVARSAITLWHESCGVSAVYCQLASDDATRQHMQPHSLLRLSRSNQTRSVNAKT